MFQFVVLLLIVWFVLKGKSSIITGVVCSWVPAEAAAALRCASTGHSAGKALPSSLSVDINAIADAPRAGPAGG